MKKLMIVLLLLTAIPAFGARNMWSTWKYNHIRVAGLFYSGSDSAACRFASQHIDVMVANNAYNQSGVARNADTTTKILRYITRSTYILDDDTTRIRVFCDSTAYNYDSVFLYVTDSVCTNFDGHGEWCGGENAKLKVEDSWHPRLMPDQRYAGYQQWAIRCCVDVPLLTSHPDNGYMVYDGTFTDEGTIWWHHHYTSSYPIVLSLPWKMGKKFTGGNEASYWTYNNMNHIKGWETIDLSTPHAVQDSLVAVELRWYVDLDDSLGAHNLRDFKNAASYSQAYTTPVYEATHFENTWVWEGEYFYADWDSPGQRDMIAAVMDTINNYGPDSSGGAVIWIYYGDTATLGLARTQMEALTWYYLRADTAQFMFQFSSNNINSPNDWDNADTLIKWWDAIAYDIGQPDSALYNCTTGTDGAGQSFTVVRRDYTRDDNKDVIMLWRRQSGTNYTATSNVEIDLGGNYCRLNADGTLEDAVTSVAIRNAEGVIMVAQSAGGGKNKRYRGKITIRGAKH